MGKTTYKLLKGFITTGIWSRGWAQPTCNCIDKWFSLLCRSSILLVACVDILLMPLFHYERIVYNLKSHGGVALWQLALFCVNIKRWQRKPPSSWQKWKCFNRHISQRKRLLVDTQKMALLVISGFPWATLAHAHQNIYNRDKPKRLIRRSESCNDHIMQHILLSFVQLCSGPINTKTSLAWIVNVCGSRLNGQ